MRDVCDKDLEAMRKGFDTLNRRMTWWSQVRGNIEGAGAMVPKWTGHDGVFKEFRDGNKVSIESKMIEALKVAKWMKVHADVDKLVEEIESMLEMVKALEPFDPHRVKQPTWFAEDEKPRDYNGSKGRKDDDRAGYPRGQVGVISKQMSRLESLHELSR